MSVADTISIDFESTRRIKECSEEISEAFDSAPRMSMTSDVNKNISVWTQIERYVYLNKIFVGKSHKYSWDLWCNKCSNYISSIDPGSLGITGTQYPRNIPMFFLDLLNVSKKYYLATGFRYQFSESYTWIKLAMRV